MVDKLHTGFKEGKITHDQTKSAQTLLFRGEDCSLQRLSQSEPPALYLRR